jgi:hypothetical protein
MFTQPSVNQIASAYQGNPAPLARKVDQDKKQNGGIPNDLRQLMALNDIAQGKQAAGIDQALKIPTNMPTVAQNTQQLAQQALQARMLQQVREQQRLQQKPPTLPLGTPQPEEQPQGLDALRANIGEGYAEGGIIGFDGTGSSQFVRDIAALPEAFDEMKQRVREEDAVKKAQDLRMAQRKQEALDARSKTSFFNYLFGSPEREKEGQTKLTELSTAPLNAPAKPEAVKATPLADIRSQLNLADASSRAQPGTPPPPRERPAAQTQTRVNAPEAPGIVAALPAEQSAGYKKLTEMMNLDPEAQERLAQEKFKQQVGSRDLSIYDRTAAELEARKQKLNAPKAGYDAMMEYLEQIALGGGRTSAESGSIGASRQRALQKERLSQQDLLMDKILDLGAKKSDAEYAQKEKMYQVGQERYKEVYKNAFDAAKSVNSSDDEAKRIAAQAVENEKNRQNQLRTAQIGAQDRDNLMSRAKALMAADPTKKMTLEQAMQRAAEIGNAGQMESAEVRRLAAFNASKAKLAEQYPEWSMPDTPKGREVRARYQRELAQARIDAGLTSSGINELPTTQGAPLPAKNQLVVGQIYQTARGPAKWNGTAFEQ